MLSYLWPESPIAYFNSIHFYIMWYEGCQLHSDCCLHHCIMAFKLESKKISPWSSMFSRRSFLHCYISQQTHKDEQLLSSFVDYKRQFFFSLIVALNIAFSAFPDWIVPQLIATLLDISVIILLISFLSKENSQC